MKNLNRILFCSLLSFVCGCMAQTKENDVALEENTYTYKTEVVAEGLDIPWSMTWLPDGSMLVTEKSGSLFKYQNGQKTEIQNVPEVVARGQGGLLDIELHPKYEENGWIYITYSSGEGSDKGAHTALIRAKLDGDNLASVEQLYKAVPNTTKGQHFGSRIEFDDEGYVFFSIGERGERDVNPQDITRDGGKIYRLHDDGRIPEDNPFLNAPNAKKAIYSYGHRNPQGMALHPTTRQIWVHEHGPRGGDEINPIVKGKNYGWPVITYGINYSGTVITDEKSKPGMEQPLYYWIPSIAPSGMAFVTSDLYPEWKNSILAGSLKFNYLERLQLDDNQQVIQREKLLANIGRVRCVRQGPDGFMYVAVEGKGILKILPKK